MKKILATLIAVVLGAGLSLVAVAAPASAHTPEVRIDCGSVTYKFTAYGTGSNNVFKLYVDDLTTPVVTETFGNSLGQKTYTFDGTTSHSVKYTIDASDGGSTYDVTSPVTVTTPCTYPGKSLDTTCDAVVINWGAKLDNSIHIHVKVNVGGTSKQVHAEFDYNIPGGYGPNKLGVRFKDWNGVQTVAPLTEQQVKSGRFTFEFPSSLPAGTTSYTVQWVQFNELHFNQDENPANWILCGSNGVTVEAEPSVTAPTCDTDGTLVLPAQTGIVWSGGVNGSGPGTYAITASAAEGYELTAPYSIELTVLPADASLCAKDPKASAQAGTCAPAGDISRKPVLFTFDNRGSELPVTFTIPGIEDFAPVIVPAGAVSEPVAGPEVDHLTGGSWDVYADDELLATLVVDPFEQCQDELTPGEPVASPDRCVAGELVDGSITIVPSPGRIAYTITGGPDDITITVPDDAPKTDLPAGHYIVTAHGINGFKVGADNTWTRTVEVAKAGGCEKIAIPASTASKMECVDGRTLGSYTLPPTEWVEWFVNGAPAGKPVDVIQPGDVVVEARISQVGKDAGVFFSDGTQSHRVTHTFTAPAEDCTSTKILPLRPNATQQSGTCATVPPTFTLSNTDGVQWKVRDGGELVDIEPGVHRADWGTTVVVTATVVNPERDRFDPEQQTEWTFPFDGKPAACGDTTTLPVTGGTGTPHLWLAGATLLLVGAGLYFARRKLASAE